MTPHVLTLTALALAPGAGEPLTSEQVVAAADQLARLNKSCGPISAYYCLRRLGHSVRYEDLSRGVAVEEDGVSLDDVHRLLTSAGARAEVIRAEPAALELLPAPSILVLQSRHCVVLDGFDPETGKALVFEPATRKGYKVQTDVIRRAWTGEAIVFDEPRLPRWKFYSTAAATMVLVLGAAALAQTAVRRLVPR
jgi:ABC-type bacteriocin/lantibiotic exporter with double-glycine peptidase domain